MRGSEGKVGLARLRRRGMLARMVAKSLLNRRAHIAVAVAAILLGSSLVSALVSISLDARGKAGKELRSYGANILLAPRSSHLQVGIGGLDFGNVGEQRFIEEDDLEALRSDEIAPHLAGYVPYLYGVVELGSAETGAVEAAQRRVILAGTRFGDVREVSPWWQVTGRWPEDGEVSAAIVGSEVARKQGLRVGDEFEARYGGRFRALVVEGVVETGGDEDRQVFANLRAAQELLDRQGLIGVVQVSATTEKQPVEATARQIEKKMPGVQARVVGQIAEAESAVLGKVELLMAIVAVLVLLASSLAAASTMATTVLERTREIGLLKALGASRGSVALLFLSEAAAIGASGGVLGYVAGFAIAQMVGQSVFGSAISFNLVVLPVCLGVALGVAILASVIPARSAAEIDAAVILRGE